MVGDEPVAMNALEGSQQRLSTRKNSSPDIVIHPMVFHVLQID